MGLVRKCIHIVTVCSFTSYIRFEVRTAVTEDEELGEPSSDLVNFSFGHNDFLSAVKAEVKRKRYISNLLQILQVLNFVFILDPFLCPLTELFVDLR
jgi:citrate lyase beta subunit